MSRYDRRMYFEALCQLRTRYATVGAEDRTAVMSIGDAIAWADAEMLDETMLEPAEPVPADEPKA